MLAKNTNRVKEIGPVNELPVVAGSVIYLGSACSSLGGYTRALSASESFLGFAEEGVDNTEGSNGERRVRLLTSGLIVLNVTGAVGTSDLGASVYASDDDTFTLTAAGNSLVGTVYRHEFGERCVVSFRATTLA